MKARQELRSRDLGVRVRTELRRRRNKTKYLLSGSLRCDVRRSSFALANRTRYQCASHHDGGADACSVSLSVPRDRIERVFMDYMASPELPRQLAEMEARWLSSQSPTIDYGPRLAQLEKQRANLVEAISSGGLAAELGAELKALTAELDQLRALSQTKLLTSPRAPQESMERRVARMLERYWQGAAKWPRASSASCSRAGFGCIRIRAAVGFCGRTRRHRICTLLNSWTPMGARWPNASRASTT